MTACLTDSQLERYLDGLPHQGERAEQDEHVAHCPRCQRAVERRRDDDVLFRELCGVMRREPTAEDSDTDVEQSTADAERLRTSVAGYDILQELHRGGQGVVYRAIQKATHRPVALKLMLHAVHASARQRQRFEREIDLVAGLRHPYIVTIYDCGVSDGQPYYAMELIDGLPIDTYQRSLSRPSVEETLRLFQRICAAVAFAHRHGVIHRDLKPANILIDADGLPHIVDFGLAKLTQDNSRQQADTLTATGEFVGTLAYAAPEQARGDVAHIDVRTDVYALGVILYEMLTGEFPYPVGGPLTEVLENIRDVEPMRPSKQRRDLDGEVEAILLKALAKEPERRYQSAEQFERDVSRYLAGDPIDAKGESTWYVLRKLFRRHRLEVGVASAFVGVIAAGLVASLFFWHAATVERDHAREAEGEEREARAAESAERERAEFQAYVANIAAANTAIQVHDIVDARERLERAPARLRGWEWSHLHNRLDQSAETLTAHQAYVEAVAFSRDGKRLASSSWDKTARVVDRSTGEVLALYEAGVEIWGLAHHPRTEEIALGCWDGSVRLWNPERKTITRTLHGPHTEVYALAFSPDGAALAAIFTSKNTQAHALRVWDTATWQVQFANDGTTSAVGLAFSPAGDQLAVAAGRTVQLWSLPDGSPGRQFTLADAIPLRLAFHPSKPWLLVAYGDRVLRQWNVQSGELERTFAGHQHAIFALAVSPDGKHAATGSRDKTIRIWDLEAGTAERVLCGHTWTVSALAYSPDGGTIASGAWDNHVKLWETKHVDVLPTLRGCRGTVFQFAFDPRNRRMATASRDTMALIWDLPGSKVLGALYGHQEPLQAVAYHPSEPLLATASWDQTVRLWNMRNGKELHVLTGHTDRVHCLAFSPNGEQLVSGSRDNTLRIWDPRTGKELAVWHGHDDHVHTVAFTPDGSRLASAGHNTLVIWDVATGKRLHTFRRSIVQEDFSLAIHPNGRWLAAGSDFRTLTIWDILDGKEVASLAGHSDEIRVVAFSPAGTRLASASHDGTVRLWDVPSWTPLLLLHGHSGRVTALAFSPDGTRLFGGLSDGTICVWDGRPFAANLGAPINPAR
jgi:WD40 repeat protein/serine/threonine protein kinase